MRIIAGERRGARLETLPGQNTRPTLERVKEGMFSAVQAWLPGAQALDLFAGSGQLGLEALSRGAAGCLFVESAKEAARVLRRNIEATGFAAKSRVVQTTAEAFVAGCRDQFDLILLDPPYEGGHLPGLLAGLVPLCRPGGLVLCESDASLPMPQQVGGLRLQKQYRYGRVLVSRYRLEEAAAPPDEEEAP